MTDEQTARLAKFLDQFTSQAEEIAQLRAEKRDEALRADNAEIATQQELQRTQSLAVILEGLKFWPSPSRDQNLARDIGRVLQGKSQRASQGLEDVPAPRVLLWKARAEQAEADLALRTRERDEARQTIQRYNEGTLLGSHGRQQADLIHELEQAIGQLVAQWRTRIKTAETNPYSLLFREVLTVVADELEDRAALLLPRVPLSNL